MLSLRVAISMAVVLLLLVDWSQSLPTPDREAFLNGVNLVNDDKNSEAYYGYVMANLIIKMLNDQPDTDGLQRERSYWRQCAFNPVSCFGEKNPTTDLAE